MTILTNEEIIRLKKKVENYELALKLIAIHANWKGNTIEDFKIADLGKTAKGALEGEK